MWVFGGLPDSWFLLYLNLVVGLVISAFGGDPYVFYDWDVSYSTASPLGVKQKVRLSFFS